MKSFILLENIEFYAHHGVFAQETCVGNIYILNIKLEIDLSKASQSDSLDDTVSYADVYEIVKKEMDIPSKLLEHAAGRIILRLRESYSQLGDIEIKLSKRNPPIGAKLDYASVLIVDEKK